MAQARRRPPSRLEAVVFRRTPALARARRTVNSPQLLMRLAPTRWLMDVHLKTRQGRPPLRLQTMPCCRWHCLIQHALVLATQHLH